MKLVFMSFLVASTSASVQAEALRSNVIVLSVLTASARSVEGHLRQDTSPTLDEQPFITGSSANDATTDNRQLQWNPNCGTLALWHPDYTAGWTGGFCSLQVTCNSPSYSTAADCCNVAYAGQGSNTCYTTAGIPVPTPAPVAPVSGVPAAGTWYPDYPAGWEAGMCINTLPLPPYGSRPLYATQLECCKLAYAGQTNNFCFANMVNPPTAKPTVSPTSKPTASPTTSSPSKAPTMSSPSKAPTTLGLGAPTTYGSQWYPKYDAAGTCTAKLPLPPPGSRSYFNSKEECCQSTYSTWGPAKAASCISGSTVSSKPSNNPNTESPTTASPTNTESPTTASPTTASPTQSPTTASPTTASPTTVTLLKYSSGSISVAIPDCSAPGFCFSDGSAAGVTHSIDVGAPPAVITNLRVKINLTHASIGDLGINLKAPNGKVLNLFAYPGSGDNMVNTVISSQGTVAFHPVASAAPFTGTFEALALLGDGPTEFVSDAASFAELYTIPSGTWTLAMRDYEAGNVGTLTSWEIEFF